MSPEREDADPPGAVNKPSLDSLSSSPFGVQPRLYLRFTLQWQCSYGEKLDRRKSCGKKKNPVQNLVRAVVKPGMGEHGNVFWRPQFPLPAGEIVWQ